MKVSNEQLMSMITKALGKLGRYGQEHAFNEELRRIANTYDLTLEQRKFLSEAVEDAE